MKNPTFSPQMSLSVLDVLIPCFSSKSWLYECFSTIMNLYSDSTLKSFWELVKEFGLSPTKYLKYTQITHLRAFPVPIVFIPAKAWQYYAVVSLTHRSISFIFYNALYNKMCFTMTTAVRQWELDLSASFTDSQWTF